MTRYSPGDVVLVHFPFTDLGGTKRRPALVLSPSDFPDRHGDVVVLPLTSRPQRDSSLKLEHWTRACLPKPTWLKPLIGTLSVELIERKLGALCAADYPRVRAVIQRMIASDFTP